MNKYLCWRENLLEQIIGMKKLVDVREKTDAENWLRTKRNTIFCHYYIQSWEDYKG